MMAWSTAHAPRVLVRQQVRHLRVASPRRHLAAAALAPLSASAGA
jgi:hypothetical protein